MFFSSIPFFFFSFFLFFLRSFPLFLSSSPLFISSLFSYVLSGLSSSGCSPSPSPPPRDNFDMRGGRYIYPLSTVITYTTAAPPSALSLDQNSRGHPNPREKRCWSPTPSRRAPTRQTLSRPPKFTKLKEHCRRGHPKPLKRCVEAIPNPREAASRPLT